MHSIRGCFSVLLAKLFQYFDEWNGTQINSRWQSAEYYIASWMQFSLDMVCFLGFVLIIWRMLCACHTLSTFVHSTILQFCESVFGLMPLHSAIETKYQEFTIPSEADTISECQAFESSSCINSNVLRQIVSVSDVKHSEQQVYRCLKFESCDLNTVKTFSCAI